MMAAGPVAFAGQAVSRFFKQAIEPLT